MAAPIIAGVLAGAARAIPALASAGGRALAKGAVKAGAKPGGLTAKAAESVGRRAVTKIGYSTLSRAQNAYENRAGK
jgi:hypothetical protein